jgi:glycerol uptake facilitator-like aquaporin
MSNAPFPLSRRLLAEALGTAILVATVVGSGIMAERLAGGNQAVALLGNTIPTGAILVVTITILGPISGAHFNPAVTLVLSGRGEFPWSEVTPYVIVQCLGGICGTVIAHLMFDLAPLAIGTTSRSGPSQWLAEAVATFTLILHAPPPLAFCCGRRNMTTKRKIVGEVTEKVEPLAVAIEALVSAMLVYEKVGKEYQGLEPARAQLRKALSGAIHGV